MRQLGVCVAVAGCVLGGGRACSGVARIFSHGGAVGRTFYLGVRELSAYTSTAPPSTAWRGAHEGNFR